MKKTIFTGSGVAIVTPMSDDGSVSYAKLGELIDFQINGGTDSIIICGTTGESSALSDEEHVECIRFAVEHTAGRVPVVAGVGSNHTSYAVWLSQQAKEAGADALLHVTPYYNKTSQAGLVRHFFACADAADLPIILYNVPSRTGMTIKPETYLTLSGHPNIVATKEASGNITDIARTAALCGDSLDIYSGNDDQIVPILSLGGKGVISVLANIMPQETHDICSLYLEGRVQESTRLQLKLMDIIEAIFIDVNPIPVKCALNLIGYRVGECRLPLAPLSDTHMKKLSDTLAHYGLV